MRTMRLTVHVERIEDRKILIMQGFRWAIEIIWMF